MTERGLREILDDGDLAEVEEQLRRHVKSGPPNLDMLRNLGDVLRQQGKLEEAAAIYADLVEATPDDATAVRLRDMLQGNDLSPAQPVPARFAYVRNFLPEERLEELRAHVRANRERFEGTKVKRSEGGDLDNTESR
ncbi:MAG: tetratricopeptide repeat protein, partial [Planctomycetota bacterium]